MYRKYIKRLLDILCSFLALLLLGWLILLLALLVRIKLRGPAFFRQQRPGIIDPKTGEETIFTLYKLRTMTDETDSEGNLLPDMQRLTKFGKFLRATSLDELPELWNILLGQMSFVGPRPLATIYLPYYTEQERHRHDVRPGLTGFAQVNGRNAISWEKRFQYDLAYVNHISFVSDLKILLQTAQKVLKRSDIGERGVDAPMDFNLYRMQQIEEGKVPV